MIKRISLALVLSVFGTTLLHGSRPVDALSTDGFDPGNIISDQRFFNNNSMSASQIQAFLNSKVPTCDSNGSQPSPYSSGTRAEYAASRGYELPLICLKDYRENPTTHANNLDGDSKPAGAKSAAQLIKMAADEYGISPQVLIVLLEKEQSLVTDDWPFPSQYRSAVGYGCPDTAACDSQYYGFYNQVRNAARQFTLYRDNADRYRYQSGRDNTILYHPNSACGSSTVYIQNDATAGLYNYTPYQPNRAALNAEWGTGDSCSAYGNRNFYLMMENWFPYDDVEIVPLESPRWMKTTKLVKKWSPVDGKYIDGQIPENFMIYFPTKFKIGNKWYLRTEYDTENDRLKGIELSALTNVDYEPFSTPRYLEVNNRAARDPITGKATAGYGEETHQFFDSKIEIDGKLWIRSEKETGTDKQSAIPYFNTSEVKSQPLAHPRFMVLNNGSELLNPITKTVAGATTASALYYFDEKVEVNGKWYARSSTNPSTFGTGSKSLFARLSDISEAPATVSLSVPRWMFNPQTNSDIFADEKIILDGSTYILVGDNQFANIQNLSAIKTVPMTKPRTLNINPGAATISNPILTETQQQNPLQNIPDSSVFTHKTTVSSKLYLAYKIDSNTYQYYQYSDLSEQ